MRPVPRVQSAFKPVPRQIGAVRWYADQPAATKEGEAAQSKNGEQPAGQADEAAKLKEQLEKKDKEIVDLKVCILHLQLGRPSVPHHRSCDHPSQHPYQ